MKISKQAVIFLTISLTLSTLRATEETSTRSADQLKMREISKRVDDRNESTALLESVRLDPEVSIPTLSHYALDRTTNAEHSRMAIAALKEIKGLDVYYKRRISALLKSPKDHYLLRRNFKVLTLVANEQAVSVAAQFVFDESEPAQPNPDASAFPVRWMAAAALTEMRLPDAPVSKSITQLSEDDYQKWRDWAVKKGLVKLGANNLKKPRVSTPAPVATPAPSPTTPTVIESPAPVIERNWQGWPWLAGGVALSLIGLCAWKRRS